LLQALGAAAAPIELDLQLTTENKKTAEEYLAGIKTDSLVALSPGTSGTNKALSASTYARFIELAVKRFGFQFMLLGGKDETNLAKEITALAGHEVIDLTGRTTVGENAALIARARFHVGCDSGPTHLAAAVKTPCLVIYTSKAQKPLTWGPWGVPHRIVRKAVNCPLICATRACQATYCADQISAEELLAEFAELVAGRGVSGTLETKRYWAAKSLNILLLGDEEPTGLKEEGFNLFRPERGMIDPLVERDISVIYNPDRKVGFSWRLAALLAGAYLNYPPVIIEGKPTGSFADFFLEKINA
ncbi:MAG: glycosyltransferase family 9 protein, partial [Candidatus Margulisiibacteriota bacterium]